MIAAHHSSEKDISNPAIPLTNLPLSDDNDIEVFEILCVKQDHNVP